METVWDWVSVGVFAGLMLLMISTILFNIHPGLALATLVPLPFIAWMIHVVRDKLRTGFEKIDRVWGEVTNVLADTIPGIRVVKAFAQEKREADRFREAVVEDEAVAARAHAKYIERLEGYHVAGVVGVMMALVGAPVFLHLIRRTEAGT